MNRISGEMEAEEATNWSQSYRQQDYSQHACMGHANAFEARMDDIGDHVSLANVIFTWSLISSMLVGHLTADVVSTTSPIL